MRLGVENKRSSQPVSPSPPVSCKQLSLVPAEQHAADDLPGVPDSVLRVGGYERHLSMMVGSTVTGG
jgi:hypothetical protein